MELECRYLPHPPKLQQVKETNILTPLMLGIRLVPLMGLQAMEG